MSHVRQQIRDAVKVALTARTIDSSYPTRADDRVYIRGSKPFNEGDLPCIRITTFGGGEQAERLDADRERKRTVSLDIILDDHAKGGSVEDRLDGFCVEVEAVLDGLDLGFDFEYTGTDFDMPQEGREEFGQAVIHYDVDVHTALGDPETIL